MSALPDFFSRLLDEPRYLVRALVAAAVLVFCLVKYVQSRRAGKGEYYTEAEMESFDAAAQEALGPCGCVMHEKVSPDIHVDILMIPPGEHCPFYTLCTMGVGAHRMNVPPVDEQKLKDGEYLPDFRPLVFPGWDRVELMMYLPAEWVPLWMKEDATGEEKDNSYWPILWMKHFARFMVHSGTWYAFGHTLNPEEDLGYDKEYCAFVLASPLPDCTRPGFTLKAGDKDVSVLQLVPLTEKEYLSALQGKPAEWVKEFLPGTPEEMREFLAERVQRMGVVPRKS